MKYIRIVGISARTSAPEDMQSAFLGMIFPVACENDEGFNSFVAGVEKDLGQEPTGYFVRVDHVYSQLYERDFHLYATAVRDWGHPFVWFPEDSCEVINKGQLN